MHVFVTLYFLAIAEVFSLAAQLDSDSNIQCNETYAWSYDWVRIPVVSCIFMIIRSFLLIQAANNVGKDPW